MIKTTLLFGAALLCAALTSCESTEQMQQKQMAAAHNRAAQLGANLSPEGRAMLTAALYQQQVSERAADDRIRAQIIANGFNNAGQIIANSQQQYVQPFVPQHSLLGTSAQPLVVTPAAQPQLGPNFTATGPLFR
jgi:hypothetical protein